MLLEFKTKNYKSFSDEADLVMTAAPKQKGLDYSLCREKIKGKEIRGLSTSVLYGPNASGKTNIIGAAKSGGGQSGTDTEQPGW